MRQKVRTRHRLDFALGASLRPRAAFRTHRAAFEAARAAMLPAVLPVHATLAAELRLALLDDNGPTGGFFDKNGVQPW